MSTSPGNSWMFKNTSHHLYLSELIEKLQYEGITVNVDDYLSIQTILKNSKPDIFPEELSSLLCPLLAKNPEEQAKFKQIFKECISPSNTQIDILDEAFELEAEKPQISVLTRYKFILGMSALLLIGIITVVFWRNKKPLLQEVDSKKIEVKVNSNHKFLEKTPIKIPSPDETTLIEKIRENTDSKPIESGGYNFKQLSLESEDISLFQAEQLWWYTYKILIKWWLVALVIGGFLAFEAYYFAKRKLIARLQSKNEQDDLLSLNLALKQDYSIKYPIQNLHKIAYKLRHREVDFQTTRINTKLTVTNTIKNTGIISPVYQSVSKQTEYLVLMSQSARRGHQWHVFDFTLKELTKQDLSVTRFYFNETPTQCWDELTHKTVTLKYLQTHYPSHRLMIFGEANFFVSGHQLAPIVSELDFWDEVVMMTPKASGLWSQAENLLKEHFHVVHADLEGFNQIAEYYSLNTSQLNYSETQKNQIVDLEEETEVVVANLEYYLLPKLKYTKEPNLLTWIAGCCILPQLSWEFTLFVGNFLSSEENQLLTVDNLTRLAGLAWFQENEIPIRFKKRLLEDENIISTKLKAQLTEAILLKIEKSIDKEKSTLMSSKSKAFLLLLEWQVATKRRKKAIEKSLKNLWLTSPEVRKTPQIINLLEQKVNSSLDFLVPNKYQKHFFNQGFSFTGLQPSARILIALCLLAIPLFLLQPSEYFCTNPIEYNETCYCIEDDYKLAQLLNKNAVDEYAINNNASVEILSLLDSASHTRNGYATSEHNKIRLYYNQLVTDLNNGNKEGTRDLYEKIKSLYPQKVLGDKWKDVQKIFGDL